MAQIQAGLECEKTAVALWMARERSVQQESLWHLANRACWKLLSGGPQKITQKEMPQFRMYYKTALGLGDGRGGHLSCSQEVPLCSH